MQFKSLQVQTLLNNISTNCLYHEGKSSNLATIRCVMTNSKSEQFLIQCHFEISALIAFHRSTMMTLVTVSWKNIKAHQVHKQASSREEEEAARPPTLRHTRSKYRVRCLRVPFHTANYLTRLEKSARIALRSPNDHTSDQPFCCLKDWMEPEWCTIATFSWFPALIELRISKSKAAAYMGDYGAVA